VPIRPALISCFCSMKQKGVFPTLDGMLVHHRVTPSIKLANSHLYTWVERSTVRVKCLSHDHNTARFKDKRTNHEVNVPLTGLLNAVVNYCIDKYRQ